MRRTIAVAGTALVLAAVGGSASADDGGGGIANTLAKTAGPTGFGVADGVARHGAAVGDTADKIGLDGPVVGPGDLGGGPVTR